MKSAICIRSAAIALALAASAPAAAVLQGAPPAVALGVGIAEEPDGVTVAAVAPGATAAALGVQVGDVLVQVGGRPVTGPQVVSDYVRTLNVGDPVSVRVRRAGQEVELTGRAMPRPEGFQVGQPQPQPQPES